MRLEDVQARLRDRALAGSGSGSGSGGKGGGGNGGRGKGVTLDVDGEAREWLAGRGYSEVYGARAIARIVRTEVLFPLAKKLLRGTIRWVIFYNSLRDGGMMLTWDLQGRRYGGGEGG